jgi:hypothetical protein
MKVSEILSEEAGAASTSSSSIATLASPHIALGDKAARKRYGKGGSPNPPKAKQSKNSDGTAKNALDMPTSIFGEGSALKR